MYLELEAAPNLQVEPARPSTTPTAGLAHSTKEETSTLATRPRTTMVLVEAVGISAELEVQ